MATGENVLEGMQLLHAGFAYRYAMPATQITFSSIRPIRTLLLQAFETCYNPIKIAEVLRDSTVDLKPHEKKNARSQQQLKRPDKVCKKLVQGFKKGDALLIFKIYSAIHVT